MRDPARLAALRATGMLAHDRHTALEQLADLAARTLRAPLVQVNLVTGDAQVPLAAATPDGPAGPEWYAPALLDASFCQHVVATRASLVVEDARTHPLVRTNRATTERGIAAYAAAPVVAPDGSPLGTVCLVDFAPRRWTANELDMLDRFAALASSDVALVATATRALGDADRALATRAEQLTLERAHLLAVLDQMPIGVVLAEAPSARPVLSNSAARAILGHEVAPRTGTEPPGGPAALHPDGSPYRVDEYPIWMAAHLGEAVAQHEMRYRRSDGAETTLSVSAAPIRDARARVVSAVCTFEDIRARKRIEADLATFKQVSELSNDTQYLIDASGRIRWANRLACERLGYAPAEMIGALVGDIHPTVTGRAFRRYFARARRGRVAPFEAVHRRRDGTTFPVEITPTVVELPDGPMMLAAVRDISERKRTEAALRDREESVRAKLAELEAIYGSAPIGLCVLDRELRYVRINARLAEINGVPAAAHVGRTVREIVPDVARRIEPDLRRVLDTGEALRDVEVVAETAAQPGVLRTWIEQWLPVAGGGGEVTGINVVAAEVTEERAAVAERERLLAATEAARAEAEAANRAKSQFLATMSHELRTPLNAINGYADLMDMGLYGPVTEEQRDVLARVRRSQRHLLGLVNEVLNYARLEAGTVRYDVTDVAVLAVLADAEGLVTPQARAKRLTLRIEPCPSDLSVRADREKVRQILVNLLSNAVKFTDAGPAAIVMAAAARAEHVEIRVRDPGIGISRDKLEVIFEPFVQVRADLTRTAEGTGLGLAISRDLARGMGGDLTAESTPGMGSTFTLVLPRA